MQMFTAWPNIKVTILIKISKLYCYDLELLQLVRSRHSKSVEFLNVLNDQVIPSQDFFFPDGSGCSTDNNANINWALAVKEWSMKTNECQRARGVIFT